MDFIEHGFFTVNVEDNILIVDAIGPFNEELILKYEKALESCIQTLELSSWNQIITLHKLSLFTPDAELALTQTLINRKSRGLVSCAVVMVDIEGESLVKRQMSRCYDNASVKHQFFTSLEDAKVWLFGT
jgi:hypothetical protein